MIVRPSTAPPQKRPTFFDIAGQPEPKVKAPRRKWTQADQDPFGNLLVPKNYDANDELEDQAARLDQAYYQQLQARRRLDAVPAPGLQPDAPRGRGAPAVDPPRGRRAAVIDPIFPLPGQDALGPPIPPPPLREPRRWPLAPIIGPMPDEEPDIGRGPGPQPPPPRPVSATSGSGIRGIYETHLGAPRILRAPARRSDPPNDAPLQRARQLPNRGGGETLPQHFRMDDDAPAPPPPPPPAPPGGGRRTQFPFPMDRPVDRVIGALANSDQARAAAAQAVIQAGEVARSAAQQQLAQRGIQGLLPRVVDFAVALPTQAMASRVIGAQQVPGQPSVPPRRLRAIMDGPAPERPGPYTPAPSAPMVPRTSVLPVLPPPPGPPAAPAPQNAGLLALPPAPRQRAERRSAEPEAEPSAEPPARRARLFRAGALQPPTPFPAQIPTFISRRFRAGVLRQLAETPFPSMAIGDGEVIPGPSSVTRPVRPLLAIEDGEAIPGPASLLPTLAIADDPNREEVRVPRPRRTRLPRRSAPYTPAPIALPDRPRPEDTPVPRRLRLRGKQPLPPGRL